MTITIDEMATFCKRRGFVFATSDLYGAMAGFFDYGPYGSELKQQLKNAWWQTFVSSRQDVVGFDGAIVANPKVWEASGHAANFGDLIITCTKCKHKERADHFIEDQLNIPGDGLSAKKINELVQENSLICTICKSPFEEVTDFNLMFTTQVGPTGETTAFLRPETAQMIFSQFKLISDSARGKLPFGVGQIGKAFRNEISPRNFLFRLRELEQMELEYFTHPDKPSETVSEIENEEVLVFTKFAQANNEHQKKMTIKQLLADKIITNTHLAYFLGKGLQFLSSVGLRRENLRIRQHLDDELAHYSDDCWDIEYKFPFGFKEMWGFADRGTFDLDAHAKASGKEMFLMDDATGKKINPRVVEPAIGLDRLFLAMMFDALSYSEERKNHVLSLSAKIAPIQVGILPLLKKDGLRELGQEVYDSLKDTFRCFYDESGSIGKRYYRLDETGCPFCVTIDYDTKEKGTVTIRNRDSGEQEIVALTELKAKLQTII